MNNGNVGHDETEDIEVVSFAKLHMVQICMISTMDSVIANEGLGNSPYKPGFHIADICMPLQ